METSVAGIITALIAVISTVVAAVFASNAKTQGALVTALTKQVDTGEVREKERVVSCEARNDKLITDNRTNTETIFKMVGAIEKLTEEQARGTQLLGDLVYGRTEPHQRPRS